VKRVADVVLGVGVVERPGQDVRIVRTGGLDDRQETARRLEDLDPAVITDDAVSADDDRSPVPDRDAGVLLTHEPRIGSVSRSMQPPDGPAALETV
jgi:hypothetical protein